MRRLVIATLLICLGPASHAAAGAPRAFYGVIPANDPDASEIARMGAGKVGTLRVNFVWAAVQPSAGSSYDWSHYDAIVGPAAEQGIRILPTVYSSPSWAANKPNYPPSKAHMNDFRAFVQAAAARYGANGTFWSDHPTTPKLQVTDWQLWTEVNAPSFWYRKPSVKQYVGLLRVFHSGIKAGDPSADIILAGLFRTPQIKNGIDLDRYLPGIYRRKAKGLFDAVAVHPYATTPHDAPDGLAPAPGDVPAQGLRDDGCEPGAVGDRRGDLVLVAGRAGRDLVLPHRPVHLGLRPEARLGCFHRPDRRNALAAPQARQHSGREAREQLRADPQVDSS